MSSSPRVHRSRHADRSPAAPARASWRVLAAALLGVAALGGGCGKFMIDDPAQGEHIGEGSAPVNCPPGFAECNGDPSDGCETSLSSLDSCGACGVVCAFAHASASCATGTCAFVACDATKRGWRAAHGEISGFWPELRDAVAEITRVDVAEIREDAGFFDLGMDSLMAVELRQRIETGIGHQIPVTLVMDHPRLSDAADYLLGEVLVPAPAPPAAPVAGPPPRAPAPARRRRALNQ